MPEKEKCKECGHLEEEHRITTSAVDGICTHGAYYSERYGLIAYPCNCGHREGR